MRDCFVALRLFRFRHAAVNLRRVTARQKNKQAAPRQEANRIIPKFSTVRFQSALPFYYEAELQIVQKISSFVLLALCLQRHLVDLKAEFSGRRTGAE